MNIIFKIFRPISIAAVLLVGGIATADAFDGKFTNPLTNQPGEGGKTLGELISAIMGFLLWVAIIVCPVLVLWGAFLIATSNGSEEKVKEGRKFITYAVVGLVIILLSNAIRAIIFDIASTK